MRVKRPTPWLKPFTFLFVTAALAGAAFLSPAFAPPAAATGPSMPWFEGEGLRLDAIRITVDATESLARTHLSFDLSNPTNTTREGVFDVPLPPHATLTAFTLRLNGTTWHGEVQERATARQNYEAAKDRGEDAVLLEEADESRFRLSMNLPAGAERTLNVTYVQAVGLDAGARSYRLGLSALDQVTVPIGPMTVSLQITSASGLTAVHLPGMGLASEKVTPHRFVANGTHDGADAYEDLVVLWTEGHGTWRPTLISSVAPGAPGAENATLVASLVPPEIEGGGLPRDIVFVLDNSGSMSGDKMVQARESLREVLLTLRPDDRFGLVTFESTVDRVTPTLRPVTDQNVQEARSFLSTVEARGGTNFAGGLLDGLDLLHTSADMERVPLLVMLSDGMPTAGITDPRLIVANMKDANTRGVAVHILAIGLDADDTFLEDVAGASGGSLTMLDPNEDLRARLNGFYVSLEDPILTNVRVTIEGDEVRDLYPTKLPALYEGDTLRFAFRADLSTSGPIRIHLNATSTDGPVREIFLFDPHNISVLPDAERIWGSMHVSALLAREWEGTDSGLRDEIITAAKAHGIVTRYTSWVILQPQAEPEPAPDGATMAGGGVTPAATPTESPANKAAAHLKRSADQYDPAGAQGTGTAPPTGPAGDDDEAEGEEATPGTGAMLLVVAVALLLGLLRRRT